MSDFTWIEKKGYLINSIALEMGYTFAVSLKDSGSMSIDSESSGDSNRKDFLKNLNLQGRTLVYGKQIHDDRIAIIKQNEDSFFNTADKPFENTYSIFETDGIVSAETELCLGIFTADCLSIGIIDNVKNMISLVHSGWRGSNKRILSKAVKNLLDMGSNISDQLVFFGPSNQSCCYKVGTELYKYFEKRFFNKTGSDVYFDNQGFNISLLDEFGFKKNQIFKNPYCTSCNNDVLYSYRAEGETTGRNMTVLCKN